MPVAHPFRRNFLFPSGSITALNWEIEVVFLVASYWRHIDSHSDCQMKPTLLTSIPSDFGYAVYAFKYKSNNLISVNLRKSTTKKKKLHLEKKYWNRIHLQGYRYPTKEKLNHINPFALQYKLVVLKGNNIHRLVWKYWWKSFSFKNTCSCKRNSTKILFSQLLKCSCKERPGKAKKATT